MNLDVLTPSLLLTSLPESTPPPRLPALERLLARANRQVDVVPAGFSWLFERWGVAAPYPFAPVLAEYDGLDVSREGWMFAEPVHLMANRDRLTMFSSSFLEISAAETHALISTLNSHFSDRHLPFFAPSSSTTSSASRRWYVRCAASEIPDTTPPNTARTGSLVDFQPVSPGAMNWRSLQNEAQMLFFNHPVNEVRELAGKLAISGVWFWGGGVLPKLIRPAYDRIVTSSALAIQLAKKSELEVQPLVWNSIQSAHGNVLAVLESSAEFTGNAFSPPEEIVLRQWDLDWFSPISQALTAGNIQHLNIVMHGHDTTHSFQITRLGQMLRFWRAAKPLSSYA